MPGLCLLVPCLLPGLVLAAPLQLPTCSFSNAVSPTPTQAPLTPRSNFPVIRSNLLGFPRKGLAILIGAALWSSSPSLEA